MTGPVTGFKAPMSERAKQYIADKKKERKMTDDQIAKLAQGFWQRKALEEVAQETVSFKFDVMGFARALLAAQQAAPGPSERQPVAYLRPDGLVMSAAEHAKHDTDEFRWVLEKYWRNAKPLYE